MTDEPEAWQTVATIPAGVDVALRWTPDGLVILRAPSSPEEARTGPRPVDETTRVFGAAVRVRRRELGLTALDVQAAGGPSISSLSNMERGLKPLDSYRPGHLTRLETALRWAPGSVAALRRGEEPTPLDR